MARLRGLGRGGAAADPRRVRRVGVWSGIDDPIPVGRGVEVARAGLNSVAGWRRMHRCRGQGRSPDSSGAWHQRARIDRPSCMQDQTMDEKTEGHCVLSARSSRSRRQTISQRTCATAGRGARRTSLTWGYSEGWPPRRGPMATSERTEGRNRSSCSLAISLGSPAVVTAAQRRSDSKRLVSGMSRCVRVSATCVDMRYTRQCVERVCAEHGS